MSIDDIITLLLILTFVAGPILNRLTKGPQKPQGKRPPQNQERPGRTRGEAPQRTTSTPQTGRDSRRPAQPATQTSSSSSESSDPFTRRLEEARRRVQEAMEGGTSQGDVSQRPQERSLVGSESAGDMFRPVQPAPQPQSQQGSSSQGGAATQRSVPPRRERAAQPSPLSKQLYSEQSSMKSSTKAAMAKQTQPLRVQRSLGKKQAKLPKRFLTFGKDDIMRGIVWKQILDEPRGKRPWRDPSRDQ